MVVTAMGSDVLLAPNKSWLLSRIVKRTARGADRVVAVAPHLAERLEKWGVPSPRLSIISLGVDSSLFKPGSKELLVLYSRGFNEIYDPLTLAYSLPQVVEQVPMVRFVLSGSGPLKKKVEALVAKMGLLDKVGLPGNISPQSMAGLTARARVMVSPSLSDGTPISVLEGLSSGCVLVASEIDGNRRWVVPGKNGLLFPPGDPDALAEALVQALTDDSLAERALRKGPQMIKADGDWHINSERVERLYFDIVGA
jgi:glycosyltransferase involved in cell wall biosynthesis